MNNLSKKVRDKVYLHGASMIGFAPISRFNDAPIGHRPADFIRDAKTVISIGLKMPEAAFLFNNFLDGTKDFSDREKSDYLQGYFYKGQCYQINSILNIIAGLTVGFMESNGYTALSFPLPIADNQFSGYEKIGNEYRRLFSDAHAAVMAGLGEFGLNNLVLTPAYGAKVRFISIITNAELEPSALLNEKVCLGFNCKKCIENCGTGSLALKEGLEESQIWLTSPVSIESPNCKNNRIEKGCYGRCISICPIGSNNY